MGKYRERMSRDLEIRGYSPRTRECYLGCVRRLVGYHMRPPDELTLEDVNRYQLYLTREQKVSSSTFNQAVCALRFFFSVSMETDWEVRRIPYQKTGQRLPVILSYEEVDAILESVVNLKHRAILMTVYAGGLRLGEVLNLRVNEVDSGRMVLRIEQGKGRKDRYVMLAETLLETLREYWRRYKPRDWLFPGRDPGTPLKPRSVQKVFAKAKVAAGITKRVSVHSLRHAFATHLLEDGTNIRVIQRLLGHKSLRSTEIYTHVASTYVTETRSPLDRQRSGAVPSGPTGS